MNWFLYYIFYRVGRNSSQQQPPTHATGRGAIAFGGTVVVVTDLALAFLCFSSGTTWLAVVFAFSAFIVALITLASI